MATKIYSNLIDLQSEGYTADISGSQEQGYCHNGTLLENAVEAHHILIDEHYDLRSLIVTVTSACETIRGYIIVN
ncbi:MAG TPA: hypothetical protein VGD89_14085 [Flavipsychrobacter sp.]